MDTKLEMNNYLNNLLLIMNDEINRIKKYGSMLLLLFLVASFLFLILRITSKSILFISVFIIILSIFIYINVKKIKKRINEINYSIEIIHNNYNDIVKELSNSIFNEKKEYVLTDNYYFDLCRKTAVKLSDCIDYSLKFNYSYFPFVDLMGWSQLIELKTQTNKKITILNWSFKRKFPEDGSVYEIIINKIKKPD